MFLYSQLCLNDDLSLYGTQPLYPLYLFYFFSSRFSLISIHLSMLIISMTLKIYSLLLLIQNSTDNKKLTVILTFTGFHTNIGHQAGFISSLDL